MSTFPTSTTDPAFSELPDLGSGTIDTEFELTSFVGMSEGH
jgi:hypothetical protein